MLFTRSSLVFLFVLTSLIGFSQVIGGRSNSEMSPKVAEATKLSGGGFVGDVNVMTGEYATTIPLGSVSTPSGIGFALSLNYTSSFNFSTTQPMTAGIPYGDGWSPSIPTISIETDVFHKYSCGQLQSDGFSPLQPNGEIAPQTSSLKFESGEFGSIDEGDIYWFAPIINIPGHASGRAIFKYIDVQDDNCVVFVLNKFETSVEVRYYGNTWVVILADGTRYDFSTHLANYRAPSNQRVLFYNQSGLVVDLNSQEDVAVANDYGIYSAGVQNVVEPKESYSVWYCDLITNQLNPLQGVRFMYKTFGEFNYFEEFNQGHYENVRTQVFNNSTNTDYSAFSDVFLEKVYSYVMDSPVDIIELDYRTLHTMTEGNLILDFRQNNVDRKDSLYSYETVQFWDGTSGKTFDSWKRYKHIAATPGYSDDIHPTNPYLKIPGVPSLLYHTETETANGAKPFDHGFLESDRLFDGAQMYPGDIYEIKTSISREGPTSLSNGNGTLDIAVRTGTLNNTSGSESNSYIPNTGTQETQEAHNFYKGVEIFSTFNSAVKWQMGYGQGVLNTSNFFVMPNVPETYHGFNIQIGPGNSDIDFGARSDINTQLLNNFIPNVLKAYPFAQNVGRLVKSTHQIPHNFGTGHPWAMMIPVYNEIALSGANPTGGSAATPDALYKTWWARPNSNDVHENIPTKFDETVKLESVELIRYSKNAYMLQGVRVYKMNGEYAGLDSPNTTGKQLVSQKKLEYIKKDERLLRNYKYNTGSPLILENNVRRVILLQNVREIPIDGNIYAEDYGLQDTSKVLTTFLEYRKFLNADEDLANGITYDLAKPWRGLNQYLLYAYVDHLGGITKVDYYPLDLNSPSRAKNNYQFSSCSNYTINDPNNPDIFHVDPFGRDQSYTAHAAVQFLGKNDENDLLLNSNYLNYAPLKVWRYEYDLDSMISNPQQLDLNSEHFRKHHIYREESAFGNIRVFSPYLESGERTYTDYEYYGNRDANLSIEEYLFYGKLKSMRNYTESGVLHDEKICNYGYTKAFTNAYERPNLMREQIGHYDDLLTRSYEYKDIYLNDILTMEVPDPNGGVMTVTGENAYSYLSAPGLSGGSSDREQPKLLEFYFYNDLLLENPSFMLQSYFVKKTSEITRVYDNSMMKGPNAGPNPPVAPIDKSANPHGTGILNPKADDPLTDDTLKVVIIEQGIQSIPLLIQESPLSDDVLKTLIDAAGIPTVKKADVLAYQQGLTNDVWKKLIDNLGTYSPKSMENILVMQPYFSDAVQLYLIEHSDNKTNDKVFEKVFLKNDYLTDTVVRTLNSTASNLPGESYTTIVEKQTQLSDEMISEIISSNKLKNINLPRTLKNQQLSNDHYIQILNDSKYKEEEITRVVEEASIYPSDVVLLAILDRMPKFTVQSAERIMAATDRDLDISVLEKIDQKYNQKDAARIKPFNVAINTLAKFCNMPVVNDRIYIETKTEYEYYEADYTGTVVGKAYEVLLGHRESIDDLSPYPYTLDLQEQGISDDQEFRTVNSLRLKHEPSWQIFAVKTSSPHLPNTYNREEYFYLYDLQNRYDRYWFNFDFTNPTAPLAADIVTLGAGATQLKDTLVWNYLLPSYYNNANLFYPILPAYDGMERTRKYGNRTLAYQKSVSSKNSRDTSPIRRSEYYHYDARWIIDDLPEPRETVYFEGDPCPEAPPSPPCNTVEECTSCISIFYKPFMVFEEIVPLYYCLWHVPGEGSFLCPSGSNIQDFYPDAVLAFCHNEVEPSGIIADPNTGPVKMLPLSEALSKALQLRDVTVQVDSLDHSVLQEFDNRMDTKNSYIAEFYMGSPETQDVNNFDAPFHMIYPFDHLTVRTILERNRYFQPELEQNQVGLQTKYYYGTSTSSWNVNSNCTNPAYSYFYNYTSTLNTNIGLPFRICVGFNLTDSLSTAYEYSPIGLVSKVTEPSGKYMNYTFDTYNRLTSVKENGNRLLSDFEYNNWFHDATVPFGERTHENFVQTNLYNSDPELNPLATDYEIRKAFLDPLARNQSVVSAYYKSDGSLQQIHSGSVKYDNWSRVTETYKNYTENLPEIKATSNFFNAFAESLYENDPKGRALRASNYEVAISLDQVVKMTYAITNNVFTSCELGLNFQELQLIMGPGSTTNYRFSRTEILDQDDKRSIEYTNAIGQKVASLKYNNLNEKIVTLFVYDSYGNLSQVINPAKQKNSFEYNILGQLVKETSVDAGIKKYMYNKQGLVSVLLDQQGSQNTEFDGTNDVLEPFYRLFKYDEFGRLTVVGRMQSEFNYTQSNEYGPLHYETTLLADATNGSGFPVGMDYSANGLYFDYVYSNASTQDWLVSYDALGLIDQYPPDYGVVQVTNLLAMFAITEPEKEFLYGPLQYSNSIGKLVQTHSYNNSGLKIQRTSYTYDNNDNIATQAIAFNPGADVDFATDNISSLIEYPNYNFRNTLLEQKADVDGDGTVDFHCFMQYDKLNRLIAISAAAGEVSVASEATLLVTYEHDDANGLILKKKHYLDETQGATILSKLVNEIEYQYDSRDRLREVKAGQMALGLNPLMHYKLFYDSETPFYMEGLAIETVDHDNNYNGNINGTLMRYDFSGQDVANSISTFAKPTLYGYTYDNINRMIKADATIGDFVLQVGSQSEIDNSYSIGDESVSYDKIGNIRTLLRILKSGIGAPNYTEFEHYNYVYETGKNRLTAANGLFGTASRTYTYDANGNVLTDTYRTITDTEYGRSAYAFHLDKGSDAIDYLYSVDDQRIYKNVTETSGSVQNYYLIDAMGKTLAIRSFDEIISPTWEYYISGAERECRLVPKATQAPGANAGNTLPADMTFEKLQATYFLYDHLGNTRVTYTPEGYFNPYDIIDQFSSSTDGWQGNDATIANVNNALEVTTLPNTTDPLAYKILATPLVVGQAYTISLDVDMGSVPQGLSLNIQGSQNGPYPLFAGTNTFTFDAWFPTPGMSPVLFVRADGAPFPVDYRFSIDNVAISQVNTITVNEINHVADYFPYGKIVRKFVEGDEERYLTTQHERDEETGLDYRGARYYDSDIGRFLSLDPLAAEFPAWSEYNYVMGNPIMFIDPDGRSPQNEYIITYDQEGNRTSEKISNLGGDDVHYMHIKGGAHDGETYIKNVSENIGIFMSTFEFIEGYDHRPTWENWTDITFEFLDGDGPEKSLISGGSMIEDIKNSSQYNDALDEFKASGDKKRNIKGDFGVFGPIKAGTNMTSQMMGKANYNFYTVGDLTVVMVTDSKSKSSMSLNPWDGDEVNVSRNPDGIGPKKSTTYQTYLFTIKTP